MKPKPLTSVLLSVSAYSPLFLILVVKDFDFYYSYTFNHPMGILVLASISIISILLLFITIKSIKRGNMPVTIVSVKNRSIDLINYTIPYIVSFFGFDLAKIEDVISLSIFLLLLLFLTIKSKSVFMNPILLLAGYNLYDLEYSYDGKIHSKIAISKHEIKSGERFYIRSLTRFLYFITETENEERSEKDT